MDLQSSNERKKITPRADYEKLYHTAFTFLTDLHDRAEQAQQMLEELYLQHTEPISAPDYLKVLNDKSNDGNK